MNLTRLDKMLADSGTASRREAKGLIKSGRVSVNGKIAAGADEKYDADTSIVCVDGVEIDCRERKYIMLYKPAGVLSATEDARQETVLDLLPKPLDRIGLFPVGRLDKDTTGLLLLTNDGDYAHRIITPNRHVPKQYLATVDGPLDEQDVAAFAKGIVLRDGTHCMPAQLHICTPNSGVATVFEGKYHQVKRMFASQGKTVLTLHRLSVGALQLGENMQPGDFVELSLQEAEKVFLSE